MKYLKIIPTSTHLDTIIIALDDKPRGVRGWWLRLCKRWIERGIPR